jgi:hypothetical protein
MDRAFKQGFLEITPGEPFTSPVGLVGRALKLFVARFAMIAAITLAVFLPGNLALQFICEVLDIPITGVTFYVLMEAVDLVLASLVTPAVVYALVGGSPGFGNALRWGQRQFGKTLWNEVKVNITVILWGALLIVPGMIAMIRLIFTDIIVAVEADREPDPMQRSRKLAKGRLLRMFAALAPIALVNMAAMFLIMDRPGIVASRPLFAIADSLLNIFGQLTTVAVVLMYLGLPESQSYSRDVRTPATRKTGARSRA